MGFVGDFIVGLNHQPERVFFWGFDYQKIPSGELNHQLPSGNLT